MNPEYDLFSTPAQRAAYLIYQQLYPNLPDVLQRYADHVDSPAQFLFLCFGGLVVFALFLLALFANLRKANGPNSLSHESDVL